VNKAENKVLAYTEKTVQGTHTTEEDTKKAKKIKDSDKRSAMFITNQATNQQNTPSKKVKEHTKVSPTSFIHNKARCHHLILQQLPCLVQKT
jgi:hypothetical protein